MLPSEEHEQIQSKSIGSTMVLSLSGQFLGGEETDNVREQLRATSGVFSVVVLDMTDVSFVNSSFLGSLLAAYTASQRRGEELRLAALGKTLKSIFELTRLDSVIPVFVSVEDAIHAARTLD